MKASELRDKIDKLIKEHGDLDVMHSLTQSDEFESQYLPLEEIYHHSDIQDAPCGVFQVSGDFRDRDDQTMWYDLDGKFSHRGLE